MGCAYSCGKSAWKDFKCHPLLAKYKLHKRLGAGAFSEVCAIAFRPASLGWLPTSELAPRSPSDWEYEISEAIRM
jgi:hypothetical protein